ncbi:MAG: hypothetical protein OEM38_00215 [Gammaproteobacteria bacterium]|nr:hypothetical protein [Gammaproteobacteria bacterium]
MNQLKILQWLGAALSVIIVVIMLANLSENDGVALQREIIYPPNLETIILINSAEYRALVLAKKEKIVNVCYELGPFTEKENIDSIERRLAKREFKIEQKTDTENEVIGYWVYLKPERSRAMGRLKVEEIKLKGLKDVVLLTRNNPRYAISLGFFKTKPFANKRLLKAQSLGLDAKMDERRKNQDYQWLLLKTVDKKDMTQHEWLNILQDYNKIELKTVNCQ